MSRLAMSRQCRHDIVCVGQASIDTIRNDGYVSSNLIGGAAVYVAVVTSSLGLRSALVSRISSDDEMRFGELLGARGVDVAGVRVQRGASTRIVLDYSGQELRSISVVEGVGATLAETDVPTTYYSTAMAYVAPAPYRTQVEVAAALRAHIGTGLRATKGNRGSRRQREPLKRLIRRPGSGGPDLW